MSKLTAAEIIEKLKSADISVEDFAHEEVTGNIEDYPEAVKAQKERDEFYKLHNKDWKWDSDENRHIFTKLPNQYDIAKTEFRKSLNLEWTEVKQRGGEGEGDVWYSVKYFPEHDVYLRVDGYYASHNGTYFDDGWNCVKEVKPMEKTITVYE